MYKIEALCLEADTENKNESLISEISLSFVKSINLSFAVREYWIFFEKLGKIGT